MSDEEHPPGPPPPWRSPSVPPPPPAGTPGWVLPGEIPAGPAWGPQQQGWTPPPGWAQQPDWAQQPGWAQQPDPSWGYGAPQGVAEPRARAAVVLGVIGLFVALVPSVIALVMASTVKRRALADGGTPATLAAAGRAKVLGIVGIFTSLVFSAFLVAAIGAGSSAGSTDYAGLQPGDCFNRIPSDSTVTISRASCSSPHNAQAVGRVIIPEGSWPGADGFAAAVGSTCTDDAQGYVQGDPGDNVIVTYIYPEQSAWNDGSRVVVCDLRTRDGSKVTGSIGGGTTVT